MLSDSQRRSVSIKVKLKQFFISTWNRLGNFSLQGTFNDFTLFNFYAFLSLLNYIIFPMNKYLGKILFNAKPSSLSAARFCCLKYQRHFTHFMQMTIFYYSWNRISRLARIPCSSTATGILKWRLPLQINFINFYFTSSAWKCSWL